MSGGLTRLPRLKRLVPRLSLHARLLLVAALTGILALTFATITISHVLERFVVRGLSGALDTQIAILTKAVQPDGRLDLSRAFNLPGFDRPELGWTWRVRTAKGNWSNSASSLRIDVVGPPRARRSNGANRGRDRAYRDAGRSPDRQRREIRIGRGHTGDGAAVQLRRMRYDAPSGPVEIIATAPQWLVDRPMREALGPLLVSLALIALALVIATVVQLRYGLRPLRALSEAISRVRAGTASCLPDEQPRELQPLVQEVNALIAQNEAGLEHARRHLANLAHGLKTPLATLSLQLARDDAPAASRALVEQLDQRIAHHLRRARSAAPAAGGRASCSVPDVVGDLVEALRRVYADRALRFDVSVQPDLSAKVDRQDLDEMLGNLLDNACRHARDRVSVMARSDGAVALIAVEDDGRGMSEAEVRRALRPGERLDESEVGYGFGLTIVDEMAELYGGTLELRQSTALGGLSAQVTLPAR